VRLPTASSRDAARCGRGWRIGDDGLIAESLGNFDTAEYQRQVEHGVDGLIDRRSKN
jgi:hypothetical protein